jgi:Fur family zinc uptake transcriptional regulator
MKPPLTKNQNLVYDALTKAAAPLSAYGILDKLRDHGFRAPLQVYRALEKLLEFGLVHRLESINAFVACSHANSDCCSHSHASVAFAICSACGKTSEFHSHDVDHRLEEWAKNHGFKAEKTTIEIRGLCAECAA